MTTRNNTVSTNFMRGLAGLYKWHSPYVTPHHSRGKPFQLFLILSQSSWDQFFLICYSFMKCYSFLSPRKNSLGTNALQLPPKGVLHPCWFALLRCNYLVDAMNLSQSFTDLFLWGRGRERGRKRGGERGTRERDAQGTKSRYQICCIQMHVPCQTTFKCLFLVVTFFSEMSHQKHF